MTDTMIKYLCSTCKGKCKRTIVIAKKEDSIELKCYDYVPDKSKIEGYKRPLERTAKQRRSLMRFTQEF